MSETKRVSKFVNFIKTLLLGGVLGASAVIALLLFRPEWFRGLFLTVQPQSTSEPVVITPSPTVSPTSVPIAQSPGSVAFSDIAGTFAEKEITQLAQLGVFDTTSGKFNPQQPITRAEFVRWLVRANNAIWFDQPDKILRQAQGGQAKFTDVPLNHPDFRYIQGLFNTGFVVGFDEQTFGPDQPITREQMIAIKIGVDKGGIDDFKKLEPKFAIELGTRVPSWTDRDQISKQFIPAFNSQYYASTGSDVTEQNNFQNVERTFGVIKSLNPQASITRAEAAVCLSLIGNHQTYYTQTDFRMASQALQLKAKQVTSAP